MLEAAADAHGCVYINGHINGYPVKFLLDTGASLVAIPTNILDGLEIERGQSVSIVTSNGRAPAFKANAKSLALGEIILYDVPVLITPPSRLRCVLLGMSALKRLDVRLNRGILTLRLPE